MAEKWYYPLQTQLEKFIQDNYEEWSCNWQNIGKSVAVECYSVRKPKGIMEAVVFVMYKHTKTITFFKGGNCIN